MENLNECFNGTITDYPVHTIKWSPTVLTLALCVTLITLFVFGFVGNLWVIVVACYILKRVRAGGTIRNGANPNTIVYVFVLSVVDLLVLSNVPFLISDLYFNEWLFGYHLCKAYWILDTANKVLSKYVLAVMSFDRFVTICKPELCRYLRTFKGTVILVIAVCLIVTISTYPLYVNGRLIPIDKVYEQNANESEYYVETVLKCAIEITDAETVNVTVSFFVVGFCAPSAFIACFYCGIVSKLRNHRHVSSSLNSRIPVKKITRLILVLICIDLFCWTPFWVVSLYAALKPESPATEVVIEGNEPVLTMYAMHVLVYVNSAINWIPYAYMNKNVKVLRTLAEQQQQQRSLSVGREQSRFSSMYRLYQSLGQTSTDTRL